MAGNNHIGVWQGNGILNIGPWQGLGGGVGPTGPIITLQPISQTIIIGGLATFIVAATGTPPLIYQWYLNGILQPGENGTTYSFITDLSNDGDEIYCNVTDIIGTVDSISVNLTITVVAEISNLEYYTRDQPSKSEELVNRVVVTPQPLSVISPAEELFKMPEVFSLDPAETIEFRFYYKKQPALETGATTSQFDTTGGAFTIDSETYFPWGVELVITNNTGVVGSAKILVEGLPLEVLGETVVIDEALPEIKTYGLQEYIYPVNHLVQSVTVAELIASNLLESYKTIRKDTALVWRGNPALELGDVIQVPEYKRGGTEVIGEFKIFKNMIEYNGTLRETTNARKV